MAATTPVKENKLLKALAPNPSEVPDMRALFGFLGASAMRQHVRLYQSLDLTRYVEIPQEAVVHTVSLAGDPHNALGGAIVWVRRDAHLRWSHTTSREAQADFLQGRIAAAAHCRPVGGARTPPGVQQFAGHSGVVSCVHEFCDWIAYSWWGGGDVYCTELYACNPSIPETYQVSSVCFPSRC